MKEIEILVKVTESKESALKKLAHLESKGIKKTEDHYFDLNQKDKPIKKWLRLRKKGSKAYITYKEDHITKENKWLYSDEYETEVQEFDTTMTILEKLGYKPLVAVINEKHIYQTNDYEIALEDVEELGLFLEIEKLNPTEDEDVEKAREKIFKFLKSLNIDTSEEVHLGKPEMLMNKK